MGPLAGARVLEISRGPAATFAASCWRNWAPMSSSWPAGGHPARGAGPFAGKAPHPEGSAAFLYGHTNKRSVIAELDREDGRARLARLCDQADALVTDLTPADERRLGLDLDALCRAHPALSVTYVTAYGRTGPLADAPADELTVQALSGFMDLHGLPARPPVAAPGNQAAHIAGLAAAVGAAAALLVGRRTGAGRTVDVAAVEAMAALLFGPTMIHTYQGVARTRSGNLSLNYGPLTDAYPCHDGYIAIAVQTSRQWETLCALLERPDLVETVPWGTARETPAPVAEAISAWTRARDRRSAFLAMQEYRLPVGMVLSPEELLDDPQCAERGFFTTVHHPQVGALRYPGSPFDPPGVWRVERPAAGRARRGAVVRGAAGGAGAKPTWQRGAGAAA
ncbi:MAG: CoA transferase [Dehalococcoidia bacterium]